MPDASTTVAMLTELAQRLADIERAYVQHTIVTRGGPTAPPEPDARKRGERCR